MSQEGWSAALVLRIYDLTALGGLSIPSSLPRPFYLEHTSTLHHSADRQIPTSLTLSTVTIATHTLQEPLRIYVPRRSHRPNHKDVWNIRMSLVSPWPRLVVSEKGGNAIGGAAPSVRSVATRTNETDGHRALQPPGGAEVQADCPQALKSVRIPISPV